MSSQSKKSDPDALDLGKVDLGIDEGAADGDALFLRDVLPQDDILEEEGLEDDVDIAGSGDLEADMKEELTDLQKGFRDRAARERERFILATDSEYWCCICFQNRAQKDAFLKAMDLFEHGDKYLDGRVVAKRFGVDLPEIKMPYNTSAKLDRRLAELAVDTTKLDDEGNPIKEG